MKLLSLFGKRKKAEEPEPSEEFNVEKKDMIRGVVELSDTTVKEIMVPRIDVEFVAVDTSVEDFVELVTTCGHSRFPVYRDTIDNVIGILYAKDVLSFLLKGEKVDIIKLVRKPYFVPESKRLDSLLREFKRRRVHIAVSVDEYGGVGGIVCMEDIIEEIVGDIQDEYDNEQEDILKIEEGVYLCDARVDIEDLNEQLGLNIDNEDIDTFGGFVFDLMGKIPSRYETVNWGGIKFVIQSMDGHKIQTIKVILPSGGPK